MKILILGAGKMGTFFCDILSFDHEVAIFDIDPKRLRFTYNTLRFTQIEEIKDLPNNKIEINSKNDAKWIFTVPKIWSEDKNIF